MLTAVSQLAVATACIVALAALGMSTVAQAQFDPAKAVTEPDAIARQFPDPAMSFSTPAFALGRTNFTTHAEAFQFLDALALRSDRVSIESVGYSGQGRAMALAVLTGRAGYDQRLPTVLLLAQQHGNEPAGGEAALALAQTLATERVALLERVNVVILPRSNPDAAERFEREAASGIDVNRDHLLLRTPEAKAIAAAHRRFAPQVVLDLHEFTVAGRWVSKFGAVMRADALLQAATVGNLSASVRDAQERYAAAARRALEAAGHRVDEYHTASSDPRDLTVSMGGVNADTGRNVGGLRNAVSLLLETRGVGIGRAHYARRVQSHVVAALAIIDQVAEEGTTLVRRLQDAGDGVAQLACRGNMVIVARQSNEQRDLSFLDAKSGEPRDVNVRWRTSHRIFVERERARPCGYLIAADQSAAVRRLRALGIDVAVLDGSATQALWGVEEYRVKSIDTGPRQDGRGAISDGQSAIRLFRVDTHARQLSPPVGTFYVTMAQPLAGLVSAALEPDSQNSYAANGLLNIEDGRLRRVTSPPPLPADRRDAVLGHHR